VSYKTGQKVTCNGNREATVIRQYSPGMYEVRLWSGLRHVGDVCVSTSDLDIENNADAPDVHK
jgi:hypothetical protein